MLIIASEVNKSRTQGKRIPDLEAADQSPKHRVFVVQVVAGPVRDKELTCVSVRSLVSHAQHTASSVCQVWLEVVGKRSTERRFTTLSGTWSEGRCHYSFGYPTLYSVPES